MINNIKSKYYFDFYKQMKPMFPERLSALLLDYLSSFLLEPALS